MDVKTALRKAVRRECVKHVPADCWEDLEQETRLRVLQWLQEQGEETTEDAMEQAVSRSARQAVDGWKESMRGRVTLGELDDMQTAQAFDHATTADDMPRWIPSELREVAAGFANGETQEAIAERLGVGRQTVRTLVSKLRKLPMPDTRLTWATAVSDRRRNAEIPAYARVVPTPQTLGDIPQTWERDNDSSDLVLELCPVANGLQKAIWEGLTVSAYRVTACHGNRRNSRLTWGTDYATCGVSRD